MACMEASRGSEYLLSWWRPVQFLFQDAKDWFWWWEGMKKKNTARNKKEDAVFLLLESYPVICNLNSVSLRLSTTKCL